MSYKGIVFRKVNNFNIKISPPIKREIVFNTDTGQHAWLDETGRIVEIELKDNNVEILNSVLKGFSVPQDFKGNPGDKYMQPSPGDIHLNNATTIRRPYLEYTKLDGKWQIVNNYKILELYEEFKIFDDDPPGTIIYFVEPNDT